MQYQYIECCCHTPEHVVRLSYEDEGNEQGTVEEMAIEFQVCQPLYWHLKLKRVFDYLFGGQRLCWVEVLISPEQARKMVAFLNAYIAHEEARGRVP
jgi:hypothetical protein